MTARETKSITLPKSGEEVVVHTYITGGEELSLQRNYLKANDELDQATIKEKGHKATVYEETQKLALKFVVVSINGKKDGDDLGDGKKFDLLEHLYSLRKVDFIFLVKEINKITRDEEFETEKKTI